VSQYVYFVSFSELYPLFPPLTHWTYGPKVSFFSKIVSKKDNLQYDHAGVGVVEDKIRFCPAVEVHVYWPNLARSRMLSGCRYSTYWPGNGHAIVSIELLLASYCLDT